ncbi:MAG: transcriptional regulator [Alicyclobacillus sp. RIFOXYA1_FULL_53_8]|nr:MAG: transcriptional regulator [Alicyclobacillus sp. RIFOXYA1_FULL_53_8]
MKPISLIDLSRQWNELESELVAAIYKVMQNGQYILAEEVSRLEQEVAEFSGVAHGIGVANGTDALILALRAFGIGPGDEVLTTPFTFFATAEAILQLGARPVFVDVDPQTFNLNIEEAEKRITSRTKAIVPVHLFGQMANMPALRRLADQHRLKIIEDACQAIGAKWGTHGVGALGDAAAVSFFPTKNLGGFGDGGMVLLSDDEAAQRIRRLRVHGSEKKYVHAELGWNSRLDELQAAVLRVKLRRLSTWTEQRRNLASRYNQALAGLPVDTPQVPVEAYHVYHLYTIVTQQQTKLQRYLQSSGIGCGVYYPLPLHLQPALSSLGYKKGDFPNAEYLSTHCLSLLLYPGMTEEEQNTVVEEIQHFFQT